MKLILRRDQQKGLLGGKVVFLLTAKASLTPEEDGYVKKYKLGKTLLYSQKEMTDRGRGLLGLASRVAFKMMNIQVTVNDLVVGKRLECKDIVEMRAVEEQIKEACEVFKSVLDAAAHFGGEEVIEYSSEPAQAAIQMQA